MTTERERIPYPAQPSLPREAPWRELEDVNENLKNLTGRLDTLIGLWTGVTVPEITVTGATDLSSLTSILSDILTVLQNLVPGATPSYSHYPLEWGVCTGGSEDKLQCGTKAWGNDIWQGEEVTIVAGQGEGQNRYIKTNDRTSLTPTNKFDIEPDRSSIFVIRVRGVRGNKAAWTHGQKDNATAGTALQLSTVSIPIPDGCKLTILAKPGNADVIYAGKSKEACESSTERVDGLAAGLAMSLGVTDVNLAWIDAASSGDGVSWFVEQTS